MSRHFSVSHVQVKQRNRSGAVFKLPPHAPSHLAGSGGDGGASMIPRLHIDAHRSSRDFAVRSIFLKSSAVTGEPVDSSPALWVGPVRIKGDKA